MKIKVFLTRGEPVTVTEEQAQAILASTEPLIALKGADGNWNGDVIHKSHIVQMVRDWDAEKDALRKNPRLPAPHQERFSGDISQFRPRWLRQSDEAAHQDPRPA